MLEVYLGKKARSGRRHLTSYGESMSAYSFQPGEPRTPKGVRLPKRGLHSLAFRVGGP